MSIWKEKRSRFYNRSLPSCINWKSFVITNLTTHENYLVSNETTRLHSQREPSASSITLPRIAQFVGVCHWSHVVENIVAVKWWYLPVVPITENNLAFKEYRLEQSSVQWWENGRDGGDAQHSGEILHPVSQLAFAEKKRVKPKRIMQAAVFDDQSTYDRSKGPRLWDESSWAASILNPRRQCYNAWY